MVSWMQRLFELYGTDATVQNGDDKTQLRVFFQSVNSRSWQNMEQLWGPLGRIPRGQYICILPAGSAQAEAVVQIRGASYRVCKVEDMVIQGKVLYQWAICKEKGGRDTWGTQS